MDLDRRSTRSTQTATALTHCLTALRARVDAALIVLGSSEGLPVAFSGDAAQSEWLAAVVRELELIDEATRTHRFELDGDPVTLCVAGAPLPADERVAAVAAIQRIWATTEANSLGLVATTEANSLGLVG